MKKIYFTITGTSYRFGQEFMELEPFRARVTAPVVSTTRLEIPSKARLCMFFLREYWHM